MFTSKSACRRALLIAPLLALVAVFSLGAGGAAGARSQADQSPRPTIVLVHGDWADASSWASVIKRLQRQAFTVVAPPNLLRGPVTDAPYLASYLKSIRGPIVLVAHSYGGFVATNAANGNDNVKALVYIDAFAPDEGETAGELVARGRSCVDESAQSSRRSHHQGQGRPPDAHHTSCRRHQGHRVRCRRNDLIPLDRGRRHRAGTRGGGGPGWRRLTQTRGNRQEYGPAGCAS
jgi:pimeloyl-ACP methyl ester carboxylesterase